MLVTLTKTRSLSVSAQSECWVRFQLTITKDSAKKQRNPVLKDVQYYQKDTLGTKRDVVM